MARVMPTMEHFLVGAYLQLVEGCEWVAYHTDAPRPKLFWIDVVGRSEPRPCIHYVDFAEKFDYFPPTMRLDTLVKKLVARTRALHHHGLLLEYEPDQVHCEVWLPRPPARRVAEALPRAVERLRERHRLRLEVVAPPEVARRVPQVVERARTLSFDYDNLFLRALLLAQGRLDCQRGAPMGEEHIQAMYRFPAPLDSAADLPDFVHDLLTSREIVHWLDFDSPTFDDMAVWLTELGSSAELGELRQALLERGHAEETPEGFLELEGVPYRPRHYSARDVAELTRLTLEHIEPVLDAAADHAFVHPFCIEVDFMVPYLWRGQERIDPSTIEREVLRYGGDRDQMAAHFADSHPEKGPYRVILRIAFYDPRHGPPPPPASGQVMTVPLRDAAVTPRVHAAVTLNYASDFTGYFILVMSRVAAELAR